MGRIVIAGLLGGIVVFCWGAAAHMVLPLGMVGVHYEALDSEDAVLAALKAGLPESGMYFLPGMDMSIADETQRMKAMEEKGTGGSAIVVYHSAGGPEMSGRLMAVEFAMNVACALIAALIVAAMPVKYTTRVLVVGLLGLFAWLEVEGSYWNWYGYPDAYTAAQGVIAVVGWLLAGLAIASVVGGPRKDGAAEVSQAR